jgi:Protein of unknown function (DUF3572)
MPEEEALALALRALAHLAGDEATLQRLMAETGLDARTLKGSAAEPQLLAGALDFLFADEALLMAFCKAEAVPPGAVIKARAALPGGTSALEGWS